MKRTQSSWTRTVPDVPPSQNELMRKYRHHHHFAELKGYWGYILNVASVHTIPKAHEKRSVIVTLYLSRERDYANLWTPVDKLIIDYLVQGHVLVDDSPKWLELEIHQKKCRSGEEKTEIEVIE